MQEAPRISIILIIGFIMSSLSLTLSLINTSMIHNETLKIVTITMAIVSIIITFIGMAVSE